jgi:hypothetical protein
MELQKSLSKKNKMGRGVKLSSHLKTIINMKYNNNTPFEEFMYRFAIVFGVTVIVLNLIVLTIKLIG